MSAPGRSPLKFPKLVVKITRDESTRNLEARVVQGSVRGEDLLEGLRVRRIAHAESIVMGELSEAAEEIEFVIDAAADTEPPYGATRREIERETSS